jgi:hypothetical protein
VSDLEHPPGSVAAVAHGCTCSPILNRDGRGTLHGDPPYYVSKQCPMHGVMHTHRERTTTLTTRSLRSDRHCQTDRSGGRPIEPRACGFLPIGKALERVCEGK